LKSVGVKQFEIGYKSAKHLGLSIGGGQEHSINKTSLIFREQEIETLLPLNFLHFDEMWSNEISFDHISSKRKKFNGRWWSRKHVKVMFVSMNLGRGFF
jgi:hypothetical protein